MIGSQRTRLGMITAVVIVAVSCAAEPPTAADEPADLVLAGAATTTVAVPAPSVAPLSTIEVTEQRSPTTAAPQLPPRPLQVSPIADKVVDLGGAIYEPTDHGGARPSPGRLSIDTIGVDEATVEGVGVLPDGRFEVPDARLVGWYRYGPTPLENGTSVLAAHLNYDGVNGVFRHLADIDVGAEVIVTLTDGQSLSYRVTEVRLIDKNLLPPEEIWNREGPPRLAMITCGGRYDPVRRSYDDNVVVFADPS